ncbi:MAG TPA: hypothetical protein DDW71_00450 [Lactobacillus sp.]|nr:hypothetical protein [Lactobacillus sp.]
MSVNTELYEALSVFSVPIKVHPNINVLHGGKTDAFNESVPITANDLANDQSFEMLNDPVVPKQSTFSAEITQVITGAGSNLPRQLKWYSEHEYQTGVVVECKGHVYQIDQLADYDNVAGIFVYLLKGDDTLEPTD